MSIRVKFFLILLLLVLMLPAWWVLLVDEDRADSFFLNEKPMITVPIVGNSVKGTVLSPQGNALSSPSVESLSLSEKDLGIPVMAGGRVMSETVFRKGTRIMFSIFIYLPLRTVVGFYEQRLNVRGSRGIGEKGEQYYMSYAKEGLISRDGYKLQGKSAKKGTRKRTNLVFNEGHYPNSTLIQVVHTSY